MAHGKITGKKAVAEFVTGDLNLHGVTKEVLLEVTLLGFGSGMKPNSRLSGWEATTKINKSDFGISGPAILGTVLGDAYVDRAVKAKTEFTADFQDLITRYAWGEIWTRDGLDKRTRSLITIAMMIALNREAEC